MKKALKYFLSPLLLLLFITAVCIPASAQSGFSVKVKLSDAKTGEPVGFATVSLTAKGGGTPLKYVLSTEAGEAVLSPLPKGNYTLRVDLMGYKSSSQEITVDKNLDLGTVKIEQDTQVLEAATVEAVGNPIVVKKDTTLVKEGEPIPGPVAAMLPKLEILPMVVGMDLRSAYEDGVIYGRDVLDIPEDYYSTMFATAAHNALALGVSIAFPTKETIVPLIAKAFRESMGLSIEAAIPTKENIDMLLAKADRQMLALASASGYTSDEIAARLSSAAAAATVAAPAADTGAPAQETVEEEEEEVSEEEAAAGLSALFG